MAEKSLKILALTGGVGGARLASGLYSAFGGSSLTCLVNTADDFEYLGLSISPDLDSLMYALSGESNFAQGWGRKDESWQCRSALKQYGVDTRFALGDRDLATHILRTQALREGQSLSEITARLNRRLLTDCRVLPMTDDRVRTIIKTPQGELGFQDYFVWHQCEPTMLEVHFDGMASARPNPAVMQLLSRPLDAIIVCPSNPYVSIHPMLELPGLVNALRANGAPVIAVSPIVSGNALKGPAAKMMEEDNRPVSAAGVAGWYTEHYPGLLSGFVLDRQDIAELDDIQAMGLRAVALATVMTGPAEQRHLATDIVAEFVD